jgi:hypothetical protein
MTLLCKYGCQTAIKFDNSRIITNGRKIPLNLDDTLHSCPKRISYHQGTIKCNYCDQRIAFDDYIKAKSEKKIPLNIDATYHDCPQSPFSLSKRDANKNKG